MENMIAKEKLVQDYLNQGDKKAAVELLFDLAVACAKEKNFEAAEAMRSRIFEVDPMALGEILRSGEILEEEKRQTIDRSHREIWAKLYDGLSVEEGNALYFASTKAAYEAGETIFEQGEWKPRLYFINRGRAKIVYFRDGKDFFLKDVEAGQFAGEDAFFSLAICTTTMIAQSSVEVRCLDANVLKVWKTACPALESKLQSFVSGAERISDLLKAREMDRRCLRRISLGGKATALLINSSGDSVGKPFKVDLCDISRGGVCFMVRIGKRETAGRLLGNRLCLNFHPQTESSQTTTQCGTIVGVQFHPFEDCTVNAKFDALLPEGLIEQLGKPAPPPQDLDF